MAMFCDGVDVAEARKAKAAGADLSTVCLAKELKKCAVLHRTKLRSLDPAYSDCAKAAFTAHGRPFEYCQFAFGRHANTSGIYKHAQIVKNIKQNENYPQLAWMEKCYHNEGDSHYREYCEDLIAYNYAQISIPREKHYHDCLQTYYRKQMRASLTQTAPYSITEAQVTEAKHLQECSALADVD